MSAQRRDYATNLALIRDRLTRAEVAERTHKVTTKRRREWVYVAGYVCLLAVVVMFIGGMK